MAKKIITGKVSAKTENANSSTLQVTIKEGMPAKENKPAVQPVVVGIVAREPGMFDGFTFGQSVKITIE